MERLRKLIDRIPTPILFGLIQATTYCLITVNFIAISHKMYALAVITDTLNCSLGFFFFRKMMKEGDENSTKNWLGLVVGSIVGTIAGMYIAS